MGGGVTVDKSANSSISSLRTTKHFALALSLITFALLAYSFFASMKPWYQVPAGLACYASYMWHRSLARRLAEAETAK
ncbi:MAG TPA: hypothetical protein VKZ79_03140 [Alphaproteobacteria bacterium]|jgi:hypothetical protein|nr:hypothetical protein [Alphaproteobacteria bacterium]